jgi:soluble lytic murein transglycosylase-like protein
LTTLLSTCAFAHVAVAQADCFEKAGKFYGIEPELLRAIAQVESSFKPAIIHQNADGSEDIGMMQINSWWLSPLAQYGITRNALILDACMNIHVGAWILKQEIRDHGYNWEAVGAYNAKSPEKAAAYARTVWDAYRSMVAGNRLAPIVAEVTLPATDPVQPKFQRDAE